MIVLLLSLLLASASGAAPHVVPDTAHVAPEADGRVTLVAPRRDARVELRGATTRDLARAVLGSIRLEAVGAGQVTEVVAAFGIAHDGRLVTRAATERLRLDLRRGLLGETGRPARTLFDAFEDPSFGFEDPSFGWEEAVFATEPPVVAFEDPSFGFEDPSFGLEDPLFGFGSPEAALDGLWREAGRRAGEGYVLVAAVMPASDGVRVSGSAVLVGLNVNEARPRTERR